MRFGHAHQTGIREIHRQVAIRPLQGKQALDFVGRLECQGDNALVCPHQHRQRVATPLLQKELRFRQNRFTRENRGRELPELLSRPRMVLVVRVQHRHQRAGVNDRS